MDEVLASSPERAPWRPLHIGMIGQKGVPATYGGIEHHVEQLGRRLVQRGHRVTVFSRRSYSAGPDRSYLGMDVRTAPTIASKHLDAIVHSATSTALALAARCDVFHYHALGPGLLAPLPRLLSRAPVVLTVHGLDHERGKWGTAAKAVLGSAYWMSGHVPHRTVVVSRALREHYLRDLGRDSEYIPNGVDVPAPVPADVVQREFGLVPGEYLVFVGRLVPEKAPDLLLKAYRRVPGERRLVIVGDSSFTDDYTRHLHDLAAEDPRVVFTGYTFGERLAGLYQHAGLFVQPSLVEGLPLTLLEALGHGLPTVASDIPPHREVLGETGRAGRRLFRSGDESSLTDALVHALGDPAREKRSLLADRESLLAGYSWDTAASALECLYLEALADRTTRRSRGVPQHLTEAEHGGVPA